MKTTKAKIFTAMGLILLGLAVCLGAGCGSLANAVSEPKAAVVTNQVTVATIQTNFVPVIVQVPGTATVTTNFVERVTTNEVTNTEVVTNTVYVMRNSVATGMQVAQAAAPLAGPYGPAVEVGLGVLSAGLAFLVRKKNGEAVSAATQLKATVLGVEKVADLLPGGGGEQVKKGIQEAATLLGVAAELHATVQEHTGS